MQIRPVEGYGGSIRCAVTRDKVLQLESALQRMPQADCPVSHHFAPGAYARKMEIKAGTVVTGAIHKTEHLIVIAKGRLRIVTDDGTTEVKAGDVITCRPGMKNAVYALEDSAWVNFFPTEETDTDKLVEVLTESKATELLGGSDNLQLVNHLKEQTWLSE